MRVLVVSAAALMLALPAGAMAQSASPSATPSAPASGATPGAGSSAVPMDQGSAGTSGERFHRVDAMSQERLRRSLEQAGFTNVHILDSAYLVQAQGSNGETVTMVIDTAAPAAAGGSAGGAAGGATGSTTGTATGK